jgi:hypothetical protein
MTSAKRTDRTRAKHSGPGSAPLKKSLVGATRSRAPSPSPAPRSVGRPRSVDKRRRGVTVYYRIQPAGLGLLHDSEASNGPARGLDVFEWPIDTVNVDHPQLAGAIRFYGDEVIEIEAPAHRNNGDVEGVRIDGAAALVVARYTWPAWLRHLAALAGYEIDDDTTDEEWWDELRCLDRDAVLPEPTR